MITIGCFFSYSLTSLSSPHAKCWRTGNDVRAEAREYHSMNRFLSIPTHIGLHRHVGVDVLSNRASLKANIVIVTHIVISMSSNSLGKIII